MPEPRPYIGGQAVVEGVMMRAPRALAVAVRRADGGVEVRTWPHRPLAERLPALRLPLLRGVAVLAEALWLGTRALAWSAEVAAAEERGESEASRGERAAIGLTIASALVLGAGLFVALPHVLAVAAGHLAGAPLDPDGPLFQVVDGAIKAAILVAYIGGIGLLPDVARIYAYHGAEHQAIYAWEAEGDASVEAARRWPRFHPRCGTAFLLVVVLVSVAVFGAAFAVLPPPRTGLAALDHALRILVKLPLMLPVAGVAYEALRWTSRHWRNPLARALAAPGMWLQRLTTRAPDDGQLEIAVAALRAAWEAHLAAGGAGDAGVEGVAYATGAAALPAGGAGAGRSR